jgi:hypothetical protein
MKIELSCVIYAAKSTRRRRGSIPTKLCDCQTRSSGKVTTKVMAEQADEAASAFSANPGPGFGAAKAAARRPAKGRAVNLGGQHFDRLSRAWRPTTWQRCSSRCAAPECAAIRTGGSSFTNPMLVAAIGERSRDAGAQRRRR